jgi:hypothetical protein
MARSKGADEHMKHQQQSNKALHLTASVSLVPRFTSAAG